MVKPTSVWFWTPASEGELVPDFPPTDITHCIADIQIEEDDVDRFLEEVGVPPLTPWQREVAVAGLTSTRLKVDLRGDTSAFKRAIEAMEATVGELALHLGEKRRTRIRHMRALYRRRQLARRRRSK